MQPLSNSFPQLIVRSVENKGDGSRHKHIALGSGRSVQEVNKLLRNFEDMKKMMKKMNNPKFAKQFQGLGM